MVQDNGNRSADMCLVTQAIGQARLSLSKWIKSLGGFLETWRTRRYLTSRGARWCRHDLACKRPSEVWRRCCSSRWRRIRLRRGPWRTRSSRQGLRHAEQWNLLSKGHILRHNRCIWTLSRSFKVWTGNLQTLSILKQRTLTRVKQGDQSWNDWGVEARKYQSLANSANCKTTTTVFR